MEVTVLDRRRFTVAAEMPRPKQISCRSMAARYRRIDAKLYLPRIPSRLSLQGSRCLPWLAWVLRRSSKPSAATSIALRCGQRPFSAFAEADERP
jgi:hypothetical protein